MDNHPLPIALSAAVPLRIMEYEVNGGPDAEDFARAQSFAQVLGEHGDNLLFRSTKKGETAELFNRLADAVAVMAFCPGGVKIFGEHFHGLSNQ